MRGSAWVVLALSLLAVGAHSDAAPYRFEDTIKTLDAAAARALLNTIPGRGISTAGTAADVLALELTGAQVSGPDEDDLRDRDVRQSDRFYAFEFDVPPGPPALPCGLRRPGKTTAHLVKRAARWWPDNALGWYLKTGRCGP